MIAVPIASLIITQDNSSIYMSKTARCHACCLFEIAYKIVDVFKSSAECRLLQGGANQQQLLGLFNAQIKQMRDRRLAIDICVYASEGTFIHIA